MICSPGNWVNWTWWGVTYGQLLSGFSWSAMFNQLLKSGSWFLILAAVNFRSKIYMIDILSTYFHYIYDFITAIDDLLCLWLKFLPARNFFFHNSDTSRLKFSQHSNYWYKLLKIQWPLKGNFNENVTILCSQKLIIFSYISMPQRMSQ